MELEQIKELVGDDNDKANKLLELFKRENDKNVSKALNTYTEKTLPNLVESEVKKRTEIDPIKQKEHQLNIKEKAIQLSVESGIPYQILLNQLSGDEDRDSSALAALVEFTESVRISKAEEMLRSSARKPQNSSYSPPELTPDQVNALPPAEIRRLFKSGRLSHIFGGKK